jgi:hypothetical protein
MGADMEFGDEAVHTQVRERLISLKFELMHGVLHSMGHSVNDLTATAARARLALSTEALKEQAPEGSDRSKLEPILWDLDHIATRLAADFEAMRSLVTFKGERPHGKLSDVLREVARSLAPYEGLEILLRLEGDGTCVHGPMKSALFSLMLTILHSKPRTGRSKVTITLARGPGRQQAQVRIEHPFEELAAHLAAVEKGVREPGIAFDILVAKRSVEIIGGDLKAHGNRGESSFTITVPLREE